MSNNFETNVLALFFANLYISNNMKEMRYMLIGDRIKELRNKLGLSQTELGNRIETDGSVISRWETNKARVSQRYIVKLAKALGTSTDYLLGEKNESVSSGVDTVVGDESGKRLIIKNGSLYINLPENSEGFRVLDKLLDSNAVGNVNLTK